MIVEWFLNLCASLWESLCAALPVVPVPSWVADGSAGVAQIIGMAATFGHWVPLSMFGVVVLGVVTCLVAGVGIKVARIVASFATLGGGGAG